MLDILITVIPVFLVIGTGYASVRLGAFADHHVTALNVFTQNYAIPCLLFVAVARLDLGQAFDFGLLFSFYAGATVAFALGIGGARFLFRRRPGEAVAIGFSAFFSNSVLLGLPITARAFGADALAPNYAIVALHAPYCYLVGITVMEIARADGRSARDTAGAVARAMFRSSLMIGLALGLGINLGGIPLPEPLWAALDIMAQAALPVALFGLGGVLTRYRITAAPGQTAMTAFLSLFVHPAIVFGLGTLVFGLPAGFLNSAVVTAAMAPGVNTFLFATMYNRAQGEAASAVLIGTVVSVASASFWLWALRT
jgi:predicted permease